MKFLKFIIRRPHISFVEQLSYLHCKSWKNIFVSLSFLTLKGFNVNTLPLSIVPHIHETQKNMALCVLGKLCDPSYTQTLKILANNQDMVSKVQQNFEMLQGILNNCKSWLVPVFLVNRLIRPSRIIMWRWAIGWRPSFWSSTEGNRTLNWCWKSFWSVNSTPLNELKWCTIVFFAISTIWYSWTRFVLQVNVTLLELNALISQNFKNLIEILKFK